MIIEGIQVTHHGRTVDGTLYNPENAEKCPVVIMSHGYNGQKTDFEISAKYLAENGIGAVCYTFCGGSLSDESGFPTTEMTLFTEKEDLCAVLDEVRTWNWVDAENIYLFGASQGGMVSALAAEEREADINGLILLYPAFCIPDDWNRRFPNREDIPEAQDVWGMMLGRRFFETIHGLDVKKHIGSFAKDVLIMHGAEDSVVAVAYGEWAAGKYPNARLEVFQNEGHGFSEYGDRRMEAMLLYFVHDCMRQLQK